MFVDSVDAAWLEHSLWKTRFLIEDEETLARVRRCGAAECWIDVSQGDDVGNDGAPAQPVVQPAVAPAAAAKPVVRKSMGDELQNAANVLKRSKAAVNARVWRPRP